MPPIHYSSRFRKMYRKLMKPIRLKVQERVGIFRMNEFDPLLDNHALQGKYEGCRSIDITGSYRLIYERYADGTLNFIAVGTHPQLYGE